MTWLLWIISHIKAVLIGTVGLALALFAAYQYWRADRAESALTHFRDRERVADVLAARAQEKAQARYRAEKAEMHRRANLVEAKVKRKIGSANKRAKQARRALDSTDSSWLKDKLPESVQNAVNQ